jgi:LmbE family N-acetylglucosaminyl deacetylase
MVNLAFRQLDYFSYFCAKLKIVTMPLPNKLSLLPVILFFSISALSQTPSSVIKQKLNKLNFLGSVLYVAAHPDDENTRIIAAMSKGRLAETAYLSMTRGDGGQNLIGQETSELLGLIRTQELLAARRIDGGSQYFTHANDFGFSKSAEEALRFWGKEQILSDVIKVYRMFKPDVIITRFPPDERAGHGHHTASAMLAQEAFDLSSNETIFPTQVKEYGIWKPNAIYTNTGRWWNNTINENTPGILVFDVGGYSSLLGESYSEIAAKSRSQHKSQGFGSRGTRGYQPEFLEFVKGSKATKDIFDNINTSWSRVKGGDKIQPLVDQVLNEFLENDPSKSTAKLLEIRKAIELLENTIWKVRKLKEIDELLLDCTGLYVSVSSDRFWASPGRNIQVSFEIVNRSGVPIALEKISSPLLAMDSALSLSLSDNKLVTFKSRKQIFKEANYSSPYWLKEKHSIGSYVINNETLVSKPENDPAILFEFSFSIHGKRINISRPLQFRETDPVKGELTRPVEIVPVVFVNPVAPVVIFNNGNSRTISIKVTSSSEAKIMASASLELPTGWKCQPASVPVELMRRGQEYIADFMVYPPQNESQGNIKAKIEVDGTSYNKAVTVIEYDHIPKQTLLSDAEVKVVRLNVEKKGSIIGYIKGSGDDVPSALRNLGYSVIEFKEDEITVANLTKVDAVVIGIRAFNTNERLIHQMPLILDYVKNGGVVVAQYNNSEADASKYSPFPITLSRDRVTDENAEVTFLNPQHPALNFPNKITPKDFDGWVQERGLYFPDKWDSAFEPLLSMNDKGESAKQGALLVAKFGKGYYFYTGLSFFRELPAAVPGAYKLFANLVSAGKKK